jgi:hypothetical protein
MKRNKIIKGMDDETWRRFTGYCKIKGKSVSEELRQILEKYLGDKLR